MKPIALVVLCLAGAVPWAPQGDQSPARVVIRPVGSDGRPVLDLAARDVSVRVDGKSLAIGSLTLIQPGQPRGGVPPAPALPAPFVTNQLAPSANAREFVIAIDDDGIAGRRDEPVRAAIGKLIEGLHPHEFVGLTSLRSGGAVVLPTTDHAAVLAALSRFGASATSRESVADLACRTRHMIGNLRTLLAAGGPERTIVAFVAGMAPVTEQTVRYDITPSPSTCEIRARDLTELNRVAVASAPAAYLVVFPEGAASAANAAVGEAGAESVAGAIDAELIRFTAGPEPVVERILATAGRYYVATLSGRVDHDVRRADARVSRPGVHVIARPVAARSGAAVYRRGDDTPLSPRDMVRVAESFRDLPLRGAGFVSRHDAGTLTVLSLFEPDQPDVELKDAVVALVSEDGDLRAQWTAQPRELKGRPFAAALNAPPGRYRMRIAATDVQGRIGTVDVPVDLTLRSAGPVSLGSLMLLADEKSPRLVFGPQDANVLAFLHVYGVGAETPLQVTFQVWQPGHQAPIGSTVGHVVPLPGQPDARLVYGGFPLASLAPGDYRMLAAVTIGGARYATLDRTIRKR